MRSLVLMELHGSDLKVVDFCIGFVSSILVLIDPSNSGERCNSNFRATMI